MKNIDKKMIDALIQKLLETENGGKENEEKLVMVTAKAGENPKIHPGFLHGKGFETPEELQSDIEEIWANERRVMWRPKDAIYNRNPSKSWNIVDRSICPKGSWVLVFRNFESANNAVRLIEMQLKATSAWQQKKYARDMHTFILPDAVAYDMI